MVQRAKSPSNTTVRAGSFDLRELALTLVDRDRMLRSVDIDAVTVRTDRSYTEALMRFFQMRERRQ